MRRPGSTEGLERRRLRVIVLLRKGYETGEVARRVGVDRRSVHRWQASYSKARREGFSSRPAPGRPRRLDGRQRQQLTETLLKGTIAAEYPNDLWTCPRVADVIHRRFRVRYHVDHIGRLLRTLGFLPQ